jgi:hypothetical protein
MPDDKALPVRAAMRRYQLTKKPIEPIIVRTVERDDVPSPKEVLRRLLAEEQAELDRWRTAKAKTR